MEIENVIYRLQKELERKIQALSISVTSGGVDNMETYKYIIGQINALESVRQELSSLLDKEQNEGTVIEKTKGGILMGTETLDRQQVASQCGNVLAMGDACYRDKERYPSGPWCKVGDWAIFARYAGSRIEIEGGEVRLLNEDEVLATVQDPKDILHKY